MTVAVLGLGEMGSALATAVLDAGHPLIVWNRSAAKAETLVAKGARLAASPEAAVAEAELVIVNVQGGEIAVDLLRALGGRATHVSEDPRVPLVYGLAFHDIMWGLLNGFLHAAALLGDAGIPIVRYAEQAEPALAGLPGLFPMLAGEIDRAEFATPFGALKHHLPSLEDLIAESRARGIDTEFPTYTGRLVADTLAAGHGDDSYSRLVEHFGRR